MIYLRISSTKKLWGQNLCDVRIQWHNKFFLFVFYRFFNRTTFYVTTAGKTTRFFEFFLVNPSLWICKLQFPAAIRLAFTV
jgi:hypothetical protein